MKEDRPPGFDEEELIANYWSGSTAFSNSKCYKVFLPTNSMHNWSITGRSVGEPRNFVPPSHQKVKKAPQPSTQGVLKKPAQNLGVNDLIEQNAGSILLLGIDSHMRLGRPRPKTASPFAQKYITKSKKEDSDTAEKQKKPEENVRNLIPKPALKKPQSASRIATSSPDSQILPFKPSHLGNGLLIPGMLDVKKFKPEDLVQYEPKESFQKSAAQKSPGSSEIMTPVSYDSRGSQKISKQRSGAETKLRPHTAYPASGNNFSTTRDIGTSMTPRDTVSSARTKAPKHLPGYGRPVTAGPRLHTPQKVGSGQVMPEAEHFMFPTGPQKLLKDEDMSLVASRSPLVQTARLQDGDVKLLLAKFSRLSNKRASLPFSVYSAGRHQLPTNLHKPIEQEFAKNAGRPLTFDKFLDAVGPGYLMFSRLSAQSAR